MNGNKKKIIGYHIIDGMRGYPKIHAVGKDLGLKKSDHNSGMHTYELICCNTEYSTHPEKLVKRFFDKAHKNAQFCNSIGPDQFEIQESDF
jgi:hypothetical protein